MCLRIPLQAGVLGLMLASGADMARAEEYLCSPMSGQLVHADGSPVPDAAVRRQWYWRGKRGEDTTTTDAEGRFAFEAVTPRRGLFSWIPAREAVTQDYYVDLPDGPFQFLYLTTRGLGLNAETKGRPFNVRCVAEGAPYADDVHFGTCTLIE